MNAGKKLRTALIPGSGLRTGGVVMRTSSLMALWALTGLVSCVSQPQERLPWPGMNDPSADPWAFTGRVDAELCDGVDNNGDGSVDEGCTGSCDAFTTRLPDWWLTRSCVLEGAATGFTPLPMPLGAADIYPTAADLQAMLATDPGGVARNKLQRQLAAAKLNMAFFDLADVPVVDWDVDGDLETFAELVDLGDRAMDSSSAWWQNVVAVQLREMNRLGTSLPLWFDEACTLDAEYCDGADNDGNGLSDDNCACIEACDDGVDNDGNGTTDEGCTPCADWMSRSADFYLDNACVREGELAISYECLPIGSDLVVCDQSTVISILSDSSNVAARLRRQLLTARINEMVFNTGHFDVYDYDGDGTLESFHELIAQADTVYDVGPDWRRSSMTTALRTVNNRGSSDPIWFSEDCSQQELCDGVDNDGDAMVDEYCYCESGHYEWVSVPAGDCTDSDLGGTYGSETPDAAWCDADSAAKTAVCWDGVFMHHPEGVWCTYKSTPTDDCVSGAIVGYRYTCAYVLD